MKILAFAGSAKATSLNRRALKIAVEGAISAGADVTVFDFRKHPMPIYDAELEEREGLPEHAKAFKQALIDHDGLLIASPEYNSGYSPLLKNAIDWASRAESADEPALSAYSGKIAALLAASPGRLGGLRGLVVLRMLLSNIGVTVLPTQVAVPSANEVLSVDGEISDETLREALLGLGRELTEFTARVAT